MALLPFLVPFLLLIADYVLWEPHENVKVDNGTIFTILLLILFQILVGLPSLLALDSMKKGVWAYMATGATFTIVLSIAFKLAMRNDVRSTATDDYIYGVLVGFVIPVVVGYLLAFYLRRYCDLEGKQEARCG